MVFRRITAIHFIPFFPMFLNSKTFLSMCACAAALAGAPAALSAQEYDPSEYDLELAEDSTTPASLCAENEFLGKPFYRTLRANNYYDSFRNASTGLSLPVGNYVVRIVKGAWSPYSTGGYWRVSATFSNFVGGRFWKKSLLDAKSTYATPKLAWKKARGNATLIPVDPPTKAHPHNLFLFIDDSWPYDNRGYIVIEIRRCVQE